MARRPLSSFKWRWLILWWVGQAVVLGLFWTLILAEDLGDVGRALTRLPPLDFVLGLLVAVGVVTLLQLVALLPLRPPRRGNSTMLGRIVRHGVSGVALGVLAALVLWLPLRWVMDGSGALWGSSFPEEVVYWAPGPVVAIVAMVVLWRRGERTPLWLSATVAAFMIGVLCVALAAAVVGVLDEYTDVDVEPMVGWMALAALPGWLAGTPLILSFLKRGPRESRLQRVSSRILLGTVIEAAAIIPMDVMVRRKTDCYCGAGTYWALTILGGVAMCALGPAALLAPIGRRRRRRREGRCEACGYDMRGARVDRCPECGAGWRRGATEAP
jgi:hypothetical protein